MLILKQIAYQSLQESKRDNASLSSDNAKTYCRERADPTVRDPLELASPTNAPSAIRFPLRHQPTKNKKRIMSHESKGLKIFEEENVIHCKEIVIKSQSYDMISKFCVFFLCQVS